jgi:hypothetical protein
MQDATRAQLCLTRLCELTAPQLLLQLWPVVLRISRLVQQFRTQPVTRAATFHFESELQRLLIEVGRRIVQWTYNHLESADRSRLPPDLFWHNDHYRLKRPSRQRMRASSRACGLDFTGTGRCWVRSLADSRQDNLFC